MEKEKASKGRWGEGEGSGGGGLIHSGLFVCVCTLFGLLHFIVGVGAHF